MKRLIALVLALLMLTLSLTGCSFGKYIRGDKRYHISWPVIQRIYAKVEADHIIFDKNDVTLDFYYGLYKLFEISTLEQTKEHYHYIPSKEEVEKGVRHTESNFAIYISNNSELIYEKDENGCLLDPKDKVNAKLWKYISFEEAFNTNYGYSSAALDLTYNHSEKITIPADLFTSDNNLVYIHIISLLYTPEEKTYSTTNDCKCITIKYILIGNTVVLR